MQQTPPQIVTFTGVVEDVNDPDMLNRIRARAIGFHSDNRDEVATDALPWAPFLGSGMSAPLVLPGDWVMGFFLDGDKAQQPVIIGVVPGMPDERPDAKMGFSDPAGVHPRRLGEQTTSHLARGDDSRVVRYKRDTAVKSVSTAGGDSWDEPVSPYAAVYPANHVIETDSANIIELDDTAGAERVHIFHMKGSFVEMHPDGTIVVRSVKNRYDVTFGDQCMFVNGNLHVAVVGDATVNAGKNLAFNVIGDMTVAVGGDMTVSVSGKYSLASGGSMAVAAGGSLNQFSAGIQFLDGSQLQLNSGAGAAASVTGTTAAPSAIEPTTYDNTVKEE